MRILLTNAYLNGQTGSETATAEIARALLRAGHRPQVYSHNCGALGEELAREGISTTGELERWKDAKFDVAHVHHNTTFPKVKEVFPELPCVYLCHGWLPEEEKPPQDPQIRRYLAVSEETAEKTGIPGVQVLRNSVDVRKFRPAVPVRDSGPGRVLAVSNHFKGYAGPIVEAACLQIHAQYLLVGAEALTCTRLHELMQDADVVVSLGRGAIEGMACGRAVVVFDHMGGDGYVTAESYPEIRRCNFSGRRYGTKYAAAELADLIAVQWKRDMGEVNRQLACQHHSSDRQAQDLLEVYRCVLRA